MAEIPFPEEITRSFAADHSRISAIRNGNETFNLRVERDALFLEHLSEIIKIGD